MSRHSQEKKEHALSLMGPPHNQPVAEVSRRTGVSVPTLYRRLPLTEDHSKL